MRQKCFNASDFIDETEFCEELEEPLDDCSLASSYDEEVAKNYGYQLNQFHKDAIKNMARKSTAKFGHLNIFSSKSLQKISSKKLRNHPVTKLMSFAFEPESNQEQ